MEQAIHLYDLCRYFFGDPESVTGLMSNAVHGGIPGYTIEDVSGSIASFPSGAIACISANNCAIPGK